MDPELLHGLYLSGKYKQVLDLAVPEYKHTRKLNRDAPSYESKEEHAVASNNLAELQRSLSHCPEAERLFREEYTLYQELLIECKNCESMGVGVTQAVNNLALTYLNRGRLEDALELFNKALKEMESLNLSKDHNARVLMNITDISNRLVRIVSARNALDRAMSMLHNAGIDASIVAQLNINDVNSVIRIFLFIPASSPILLCHERFFHTRCTSVDHDCQTSGAWRRTSHYCRKSADKQQLLIISRHRKRVPQLTPLDRFLLGFWSLFLTHRRIQHAAVIIRPTTLLKFHQWFKQRKYRLLYASSRKTKPGPTGPSKEIIDAVVELRLRNPQFGCPRITQQINQAFGISIDKDVVKRILAAHYPPDPGSSGPWWLAFLGYTKDSLWSVNL